MRQLRKVLEIGRINLLRQVRDRGDLFFVFVLPTIIIVALGLQFGGTARARLGVVAPVGDAAAEALLDRLAEDTARFEIRRVADLESLESQVERGQLEAGLVIPDGFTLSLGWPGQVEIRYLGTTDSLTGGLRAPIDAVVARLGAITTAARISVAEGLATPEEAAAAAEARYETVPGVEVSVRQVGEPGMFAGFSQFTFGASTQLILFMFLTSMTAAARLVYTRQLGLSRRMTATPTSTWTIVAGEALGRYLVALMQAAYIVVVTAVAFNVSWGDPLAAGVIIALFGLVAAGFALLVGAMSSNADQAGSAGGVPRPRPGGAGRLPHPVRDHARGDAVHRPPDPPLLGAARPAGADPDRRRARDGGAQRRRAGGVCNGGHGPRHLAVPEGDLGVGPGHPIACDDPGRRPQGRRSPTWHDGPRPGACLRAWRGSTVRWPDRRPDRGRPPLAGGRPPNGACPRPVRIAIERTVAPLHARSTPDPATPRPRDAGLRLRPRPRILHATLIIYASRRAMDRQSLLRELLEELAAHSPAAAMRHMRHWPGGRLSLVHVNVLAILELDGALTMRGLAEAMDVSQASTTGIVDRMEQRGLVERQRDDQDRRVVRVALTEEGRRLIAGMTAERRDHLAAMLDTLTDEELAGFLLGSRAMRRARDRFHATQEATR